MLLAHIDVVEARREDWARDPFKLVEEGGYFYARGAIDDKAMASIFTDLLVRWSEARFVPRRGVRLALTCGEETPENFNGVRWLLASHPELMRAKFVINEGAGGLLDPAGKPVSLDVQAGEKVHQDFTLELTHKGGHSSRPTRENPISRMAAAVTRLAEYQFPVALNDVTRGYFRAQAEFAPPEVAADLQAILRNPADDAVAQRLWTANPTWNGMMRTTCVATQFERGTRTQRPAATRARQRELPDPAGYPGRCNTRRSDTRDRRCRNRGPHHRRKTRDRTGSPIDSGDHGPDQDTREKILAGGASGANHGDRWHGRPLFEYRRYPDVRYLRHLHGCRAQWCARPQ